jgi:hypothetical protein
LKSTQGIISEFMGRARATKRQLQSLAGKLCHAAKVIRGGRTFLRRLFSCISKLKSYTMVSANYLSSLTMMVEEDFVHFNFVCFNDQMRQQGALA